jgi:hypothetical protein
VRKAIWDTLMDLFVALSVITSLYFLAFGNENLEWRIIDGVIFVVFCADLIVNFVQVRVDSRGRDIDDIKGVALKYAKGWLLFDFLAVFPFGFSAGLWEVEYLCRLVRLFKLPKALNMLDGRGVSLIISFLKNGEKKDSAMGVSFTMKFYGELANMMLIMVLVCYALACLWYWYVAKVEDEEYS